MDEKPGKKQTNRNGSNNGEAFVRLLLDHEPKVRGFLRGLLPTWSDVDEVIQEASLIAWRKFDDFEEETSFGGWFLTIARFEALKHRRKIARTPLVFKDDLWDLLVEEATGDEATIIRKEHLTSCLKQMAPDKRELLLKVHSQGVVTRQVAQEIGKSEQAFYKMIQRLRASLMDCISKLSAMEA